MKLDELLGSLCAEQKYSIDEVYCMLEDIRSKNPIIYNIETTNRCNMKCKMCPRTTMMSRDIADINYETFINVINQVEPHTKDEWEKWVKFCKNKYGINENEMSENHFFLYIIPRIIQLHGYGDPLLDKNMSNYIKALNKRGFYSYFSCNPANINLDKTFEMMESGLDYIKYSIESVDDAEHKKIRGEASNFNKSFNDIKEVIKFKEKANIKTEIIITMLDLNRKNQKEDYKKLRNAFNDLDVYIYLKSEDCQWYRKDYHGTKSIHWSEICKHPWMSMTVKSNGEATMCMEDFNNEIILGDVNNQSLKDIWNGENYSKFRKQHLRASDNIKCVKQCDMSLIGDCYKIN